MKWYQPYLLVVCMLLAGCGDDPTDSDPSESKDVPANFECTDGMADNKYPCHNIDLLARVSPEDLMAETLSEKDSSFLNDIWGWTDPLTGTEYALVGLNDGVTFVDISAPSEPVVVGKLQETASVSSKGSGEMHMKHEKSTWRDFKVYENYLFVVSDQQPHGLQVFDLTKLRDVANPPATFSEDHLYEEFGKAHNIAINEESGFAYVVGSDTYGGGLHILDIQDPLSPQFVGFHSDSTVGRNAAGYVHDTQCVIYEGPDKDYPGDEICFNSSETHLVVAKVTDKQNAETISKRTFDGNHYAHQGWLTEDQRYFLLDDELDERRDEINTRTYIWDVQDLDNPELIGNYTSALNSIDHNQYVKGNYTYQANYTGGMRILSLDNIAAGDLQEVAYFDTYPSGNFRDFDGAWSNYPFFESGILIVSDISNGLFILKPNLE